MTRTIRCLAALMMLLASPQTAFAADPKGDWIGPIEVNASTRLRLAIHIEAHDNGELKGTAQSIDQGDAGAPLAEIVSADDGLSFAVPAGAGRYRGTWDEGQKAWVGLWSQAGRSFPLVLKAAAVPPPPLPGTSPATGTQSGDRLEPGKQGETMPGEARTLPQPYSKGVHLVGHTALGDGVGSVMTWAGHCAYVPGRSGVTVIDVKDPRAPKVVGLLREKGAVGAGETIHAASGILAASVYAQVRPDTPNPKDNGWLAVYDVSDCAKPRLMLEYKWPEHVHTITVSPNGRRIYGTVLSPFTGEGGIQVLDIADRTKPRFLGKLGVTRPDGSTFEFAPHAVSISADERRIYAGVTASKGADLNRGIKLMPPTVQSLGPDAGGIYILDNSDIARGRPEPRMRLIGTAQHAGWHSPVPANINGVPHLVSAGELMACPGSWPRITNIADEKNPRVVGHFRLQMNMKENCPPPDQTEIASTGIVGRAGTAASHWNDVDSAVKTRLGLFPFIWAGLRIVDLRDPPKPVEIAYFKPGGTCMTRARYVPDTGHIWFACQSGFYAIELRPELRASLGLPKVRAVTARQ